MARSTVITGVVTGVVLVAVGAGLATAVSRPPDEPFVDAVTIGESASAPAGVDGSADATTADEASATVATSSAPPSAATTTTDPATTAVTAPSPPPVTSAPVTAAPATETDDDDEGSHGGGSGNGGGAVPAGITSDRAASIALSVAPGTVDEVKLENHDGQASWKVKIEGSDGTEYEIRIDPQTGAVLSRESND
jgi:uncharacterized membrane protein YkoI